MSRIHLHLSDWRRNAFSSIYWALCGPAAGPTVFAPEVLTFLKSRVTSAQGCSSQPWRADRLSLNLPEQMGVIRVPQISPFENKGCIDFPN